MSVSSLETSPLVHWWNTCRRFIRSCLEVIYANLFRRRKAKPILIGDGPHDCALASLFWAAPALSEAEIIETFNVATESWPYGGVTNKEFAIALKYLKVDSAYSNEVNTLKALLALKPPRCVALLRGHFIAIVDGAIVGRDAHRELPPDTRVYCHWTFTGLRSR